MALVSLIPTMSGAGIPYYYASASSERSSTTYAAWKAFDGSTGRWSSSSAGKLNCWLMMSFYKPKIVTRYIIDSTTTEAPKAWKFQGYDVGTVSWVDLDSQSGITDWSLTPFTYDFVNATAYTHYRIYITEQNGGTYTSIYELSMWAEDSKNAELSSLDLQTEIDTTNPYAGISGLVMQAEYDAGTPIAIIGGSLLQVEIFSPNIRTEELNASVNVDSYMTKQALVNPKTSLSYDTSVSTVIYKFIDTSLFKFLSKIRLLNFNSVKRNTTFYSKIRNLNFIKSNRITMFYSKIRNLNFVSGGDTVNVFNKQPSETFLISVNFVNSLSSDTISSYTVKAYNKVEGVEEEVTATVLAENSNGTQIVYQRVFAGETGKDYKITFVITSALGYIYEEDVIMKVREI
ncbi:MAG: discoidin domain-containing protein [Syntrophothermus sp.]